MAASKTVTTLVEAIHDALGGFAPEKLCPDVEDFLSGMPEVWEAMSEQVKKVASRMEDGMPVHAEVPDALRELIPHLDRLAEASREANEIFRRKHEEDLKRYHEPRNNEPAANV